jgi:hypothetical protein
VEPSSTRSGTRTWACLQERTHLRVQALLDAHGAAQAGVELEGVGRVEGPRPAHEEGRRGGGRFEVLGRAPVCGSQDGTAPRGFPCADPSSERTATSSRGIADGTSAATASATAHGGSDSPVVKRAKSLACEPLPPRPRVEAEDERLVAFLDPFPPRPSPRPPPRARGHPRRAPRARGPGRSGAVRSRSRGPRSPASPRDRASAPWSRGGPLPGNGGSGPLHRAGPECPRGGHGFELPRRPSPPPAGRKHCAAPQPIALPGALTKHARRRAAAWTQHAGCVPPAAVPSRHAVE